MGHKGKLYAAISYWIHPRDPWYGGTDLREGWAQVLRLDAADAAWQVDAQFPRHLRLEILYSASFRTDAGGLCPSRQICCSRQPTKAMSSSA